MPWRHHTTIAEAYASRVASGEFSLDPAQVKLAKRLDALLLEVSSRRLARKSSALGWMFARKTKSINPPRGLYVHGAVGRGKTMLMDMFYELVPASASGGRISMISWRMCMPAFMPTARS
jgi:cell division protein ZapE